MVRKAIERVTTGILCLVVLGLTLKPVLESPYLDDDRFDSIWNSVRWRGRIGLLNDTIYWTETYANNLKRFHPLAHLVGVATFHFWNSRETLKTAQFIGAMVVYLAFAIFLGLWMRRPRTTFLFVLLTAPLLRLQERFDPILGFGLHLKVALILVSAVFIALVLIRDDHPVPGYAILVVGTLASVFYYELCVVGLLAAIPVALALPSTNRRRCIFILGSGVSAYAAIRLILLNRSGNTIPLAYYQANIEPRAVVATFLRQLSGTFPVTSASGFISLTGLVCGLLVLISSCLVSRNHQTCSGIENSAPGGESKSSPLIWCAALLIIFSALVPSLSSGHQTTSKWFTAYLNSWPQLIGVQILMTIAADRMLRRSIKWPSRALLCLLLTLAATWQSTGNLHIVQKSSHWETALETNGYERENFEVLISKIPEIRHEGDPVPIWSVVPRPWMNTDLVRAKVGLRNGPYFVNNWARFSPVPQVIPKGCRLRNRTPQVNLECDKDNNLAVYVGGASFHDGYIAYGTLTGYSFNKIADFQIALNSDEKTQYPSFIHRIHPLFEEAKFIVRGTFATCRRYEVVNSKSQRVKLDTVQMGAYKLLRLPHGYRDDVVSDRIYPSECKVN